MVKESICNAGDAGDMGLIPGLGRSPKSMVTPSSIFAGKSHEQKGLAGHSPWDHKESDTNEATQHACTYAKQEG